MNSRRRMWSITLPAVSVAGFKPERIATGRLQKNQDRIEPDTAEDPMMSEARLCPSSTTRCSW